MDIGWPPLSFVILLPLIGGLVCLGPWFAPERDAASRLCRTWSLVVSSLTLALLLAVAQGGMGAPDVLLSVSETRAWIPSLGIFWNLTLDGLSLAFTLLTCVVSLAVLRMGGVVCNCGFVPCVLNWVMGLVWPARA